MKNEAPKPGGRVRGSSTGRPVMALLDQLGRRGSLRILWELRDGEALTFRALGSAAQLPPATLNTRLHELREQAFVELAEGYRLTALGKQLIVLLMPLHEFSQRWAKLHAQK